MLKEANILEWFYMQQIQIGKHSYFTMKIYFKNKQTNMPSI